jgi:hypothetical protein
MGLASCSRGADDQSAPTETSSQTSAPAATGKYGGFNAVCKPLTEIQPYLATDDLGAPEVAGLLEQIKNGAASVPDAEIKDAILAFSDTPVDAGRKFADAYTAAREACVIWGASLSGGNNGGTATTAPAQQNEKATEVDLYQKTCKPVVDIAKSYQEGTLDLGSVPKTIEAIAPLIADVPNIEARTALQTLVDDVDAESGVMALFASALQACGAWGSSMSSK